MNNIPKEEYPHACQFDNYEFPRRFIRMEANLSRLIDLMTRQSHKEAQPIRGRQDSGQLSSTPPPPINHFSFKIEDKV